MDALRFECLRHLRVARQTEIFPGKVRLLRVRSRYLMTVAAAGLGEGRVSNGFDQAFIVGTMRVVALGAVDAAHCKRGMCALNLRCVQVMASETELAWRAF